MIFSMNGVKVISKISILVFLYYLIYSIYSGIINPIPALGDSWDYHIPISQTILNGSFLRLRNTGLPQWYYPGSGEAINSVLIFLRIPLTLSNILAILILGLSLYQLGKVFGLKKFYSLLFSMTFITLNAVIRWMNAVSIDVWMAVFFVWVLILLENPRSKILYFLKLGFVTGMIIGTKYSGIYLLVVLFFFYLNKKRPKLNLKRIVSFLIPFFTFGIFWYIRNYLTTGNPFYPFPLFNFPGIELFKGVTVYSVTLQRPWDMFNAFFSEYKLWMLVPLVALAVLFKRVIINKKYKLDKMHFLYLLGLANFVLYFSYPCDFFEPIMVSSLRYSYTAFIPLLLATFILAEKINKKEMLGYFAIGNMIMVTSFNYYPKLVIIYIPLSFILFRLLGKVDEESKIGQAYTK